MRATRVASFVCVLAVLAVSSAFAEVPSSINVQGRVTDSLGVPLPSGAKDFTFTIHDAPTGGTKVWPGGSGEIQSLTTDAGGRWTALVGALDPLTDAVFSDSVRWLEITVDDGIAPPQTLPRVRLVAGPYAYRVSTVDGASGGLITSQVTIGSGHTNSGADGFVAGLNNAATGDYNSIAGGKDNSTGGYAATISGGEFNTAPDAFTTVGGGSQNNANGGGASILGGVGNTTGGDYATIGGGTGNYAPDTAAVVGGGAANAASGIYATVSGGRHNTASGAYSTVAGGGDALPGLGNVAAGHRSAVGGGWINVALGFGATIAGGEDDSANGWSSSILGGRNNRARATGDAIGGGIANEADGPHATVGGGNSNFATGENATIAGGIANSTRDSGAVVCGGTDNAASGVHARVGGGMHNRARGRFAVVAGGGGDSYADSNSARGEGSFIGAGSRNVVGAFGGGSGYRSAVISGRGNIVDGIYSMIGSGDSNYVGGQGYNFIGAGRHNTIHIANDAFIGGGEGNYMDTAGHASVIAGGRRNRMMGSSSTICGGDDNYVKHNWCSVIGGRQNSALGLAGSVLGGEGNTSDGLYSLSAGYHAKALHSGCFVWADYASLGDFASTDTSQFLIRASGGCGINTNAPKAPLTVAGANKWRWTIGNGRGDFTVGNALYGLCVGVATDGGGAGTVRLWPQGGQKNLRFGNSVAGDAMTIDSLGYVGIGTTNPANILAVAQSSATDPIADAWTVYSSRRWKHDIVAIPDALEKVQQLRGVTYRWNTDNRPDVGLIAEEVGTVIPEVVSYDDNGVDAKSVDYARLVAVLIEAVKQQQQTIDALTRRVEELER